MMEALAFDVYGTLVDPIRITTALEHVGAAETDTLMDRYNRLERFADVAPGLDRLQQAGHPMVVFSNGSPWMLEPLMAAAGLDRWFDGFLSVDPVRGRSGSSRRTRSTSSAPAPQGCARRSSSGR